MKEDGVWRLEVGVFKYGRKEVAQRGNEKREREEMKMFRDKEKKGKKERDKENTGGMNEKMNIDSE